MRQSIATAIHTAPGAATRRVEVGRDHPRSDAMRWLASQLGWERTLERLRGSDPEQAARAA
jgi:hypothetical protein